MKSRIIGFSGTRYGMTWKQRFMLQRVLETLTEKYGQFEEVYHGGCMGADEQFNYEVNLYVPRDKVHVHPSNVPNTQVDCSPCHSYPVKDPLDRNTDIVESSDVMIFTPKEPEEITRSGTWSTWRKSKKEDKHIFLILPDGKVEITYPPSLKPRRTLIQVEKVQPDRVGFSLANWYPEEVNYVPLEKIPEEFRSILKVGDYMFAMINTGCEWEDKEELTFYKFLEIVEEDFEGC